MPFFSWGPLEAPQQQIGPLPQGPLSTGETRHWRFVVLTIWGLPKMGGTPKWCGFIVAHAIKMDDLGVPPFLETTIFECTSSFASWRCKIHGMKNWDCYPGSLETLVEGENQRDMAMAKSKIHSCVCTLNIS